MLRNHFKIAWRGLLTSKAYSALNIGGLAVALGIGMLLLWWVKDELNFDRFHTKSDLIYRVNGGYESEGATQLVPGIPAPVAVFSKRQVPGVVEAARVVGYRNFSPFKAADKTLVEDNSVNVDPAFFALFDFQWVKGNPKQPFPDLYSVVLTESTARRYFGTAEPMGKLIYSVPKKKAFVVSGIVRDAPDNSTLDYGMFMTFESFFKDISEERNWGALQSGWGDWMATTYLQVHPQANPAQIAGSITSLHHQHNQGDEAIFYRLQALTDIHRYNPDGSPAAMQEVRMMGLVALILLSIGCINYVNLATARANQRAKEVSVRKVVGAGRRHLIGQFLAESLLIFGLALLLALALIYSLEPVYRELTGKTQSFSLLNPQVWLVLTGALLFTLAVAGIYPALVLSSFEPLNVLRGKAATTGRAGLFRKALVVSQFTLSTALIAGTLVIGQQLRFIRDRNLGYDRENVFSFWLTEALATHFATLKSELMQQPGVLTVAASDANLLQNGNTTGDVDWDGKSEKNPFVIHPLRVDQDFIQTFKLTLVAGDPFTGSKADSTHFILNETAVKSAGIRHPIGKRFKLHETEGIISGVVKDFHFASMHANIEPTLFIHEPHRNLYRIYIKTTGREAPKALAATERIWKRHSPDYPFQYSFMDDDYNRMYQSEQRTGQLFNFFAGIAILISCLGLFGLVTFTAGQRTKEIGIRKVLGASVAGIVALLSNDFLKLVFIAIVIATPLAWYAMHRWLQDFAYKITIEWWVFALAGVLAVGIAFLTVSFQSIKAALMNPVNALKSD